MIYQASKSDLQTIVPLALSLWEHHTFEDLAEEFDKILSSEDCAVFLSFCKGVPTGFAQCQLRHDYTEGTSSSPVGYLEGIFVRKEYRRQGTARELLSCCEAWARRQGCSEFASDCELDNCASFAFHMASGFREAGRIICFAKPLSSS